MIGQGAIKDIRGEITNADVGNPAVGDAIDLTDGGRDLVLEFNVSASAEFTFALLTLNRAGDAWQQSQPYSSGSADGADRRFDVKGVGNEEMKVYVKILSLTGTINDVKGYSTNLSS